MKHLLFLTSSAAATATAVAAGTCGCGLPSGYQNKTTLVTLNSGRSIYYHLPNGYDGTTPADVFFSFHGGSKNALEQEALSGLSDPFFNPSGIAIYPQGDELDAGSGEYYWIPNPQVSTASPNDLDFVLEILDWVDQSLCMDQKYATGKSDGGGLVNLLACNSTTNAHFAAFASVSGAYYEDSFARNCNPGRPIPMVSFHGLNDTTIPYAGKNAGTSDAAYEKTYPIDTWLKQWVTRNGITSAAVNTSGEFAGLVTESAWSRNGYINLTTFYMEQNLGHVWPSTLPNDDCRSPSTPKCPLGHYTFNATSIIVEYLQQWTLTDSDQPVHRTIHTTDIEQKQ